jgi:hypothetical protein
MLQSNSRLLREKANTSVGELHGVREHRRRAFERSRKTWGASPKFEDGIWTITNLANEYKGGERAFELSQD